MHAMQSVSNSAGPFWERLMLYGEGYLTLERWCLWCGRGTQQKDPGGCTFSSFPGATQLSLSSPVHSNMWYMYRSSGCKWDFVCWPFKKASGFLEDSCVSLADIPYIAIYNVHIFTQIFEGKIRMHIIHGYNDCSHGHNNPMYNVHKMCMCIIHCKIW